MDPETYGRLIGRIYDCAVDPELWNETLTEVRDAFDLAFVSLNYMDFAPTYPQTPPDMRTFITPWDMEWIETLGPLVPEIPRFDEMRNADIDIPVSQLSLIEEHSFHRTSFYKAWVEPQRLRDTCNINVIKRERQNAMMSATIYQGRELFSQKELELIGGLSQHIRRALMIADIADEQKTWIRLYNELLDEITVAIFLVNADGHLQYRNAAGEELLEEACALTVKNGKITPSSPLHASAFESAVARACKVGDGELGSWGNGMLLPGRENRDAVAYLLPFGQSEMRRALGPGLAAVFVTTKNTELPPQIEVISALSGLTISESRVALALASGESTQEAASRNGISIHTLRKHLSNIYEKTGVNGQAGLVSLINRLKTPLRQRQETET